MAKAMTFDKINVSELTFSEVKTLGNGAQVIYINKGEGVSPIYIQSPEMNLPFDSGKYYPDNDNSGKYPIKVAMENIESNHIMKVFHDKLCGMDDHLINMATKHAEVWFKNQKWMNPKKTGSDREKVQDNYKPMVKVSVDSETGEPNGKWAPQFQFKIVKRDGEILCKCYSKNDLSKAPLITSGENSVDLETMFKKGTKVKMILKCNGIWVSNVGWGVTWRAEQIRIDTPVVFDDYAFDDSEDEGVELSRNSSVVPKSVEFVDSDSDEDDGDGEEEVIKKVVKRN